jgi:hypothetical protein
MPVSTDAQEERSKLLTNEISVLEVEAVELVASRLCVHYIFIDDEGGALGVVGNTLANLAVLY